MHPTGHPEQLSPLLATKQLLQALGWRCSGRPACSRCQAVQATTFADPHKSWWRQMAARPSNVTACMGAVCLQG
eukprot:3030102-Alexandrium_andersonii.AAC.1